MWVWLEVTIASCLRIAPSTTVTSTMSSIETAEEAYSANQGTYTASPAALVSGGLLHKASTKINVVLIPVGAGSAASNGPDGLPGTADDIPAIPARMPLTSFQTMNNRRGPGLAGGATSRRPGA